MSKKVILMFSFLSLLCFSSMVGCGEQTGAKDQNQSSEDTSKKGSEKSFSATNTEACEKYIQEVQELYKSCGNVTFPANAKPDCSIYEKTNCSVKSYFDCLRGSYECSEIAGTKTIMPDAEKIRSCTVPTCR